MDNQSQINKKAWEYRAYEFWCNYSGNPKDFANKILKDPKARLRYHSKYFTNIDDEKIANPLGSNARIAVPLALLGAEVTVFDISDGNKKYGLELAKHANTEIEYVLGDFYKIDIDKYKEYFDISYSEGGILHYFNDINLFMNILYKILKKNGKLILSDFHPLRKLELPEQTIIGTDGNYFDSNMHLGNVAYKKFFPENEQKGFPDCQLRYYTLSEIINSMINAGFKILEFSEHPNWNNSKLPGEFTLYCEKV